MRKLIVQGLIVIGLLLVCVYLYSKKEGFNDTYPGTMTSLSPGTMTSIQTTRTYADYGPYPTIARKEVTPGDHSVAFRVGSDHPWEQRGIVLIAS
jgi:hypothetical protein